MGADMLTKLKTWLDEHEGWNRTLMTFQKSIPLAEVSLVSEKRKLIHHADLSKVHADCCGHGEELKPLHLVLFTDCLVLCSIRQNMDPPVVALMKPFMEAAGCPRECMTSRNEWTPPCHVTMPVDTVSLVLKMWWERFKGITRSQEDLRADINTCFEKSEKFNRAASVAFTFVDLIDLLQPLAQSMG